MSRVVYSMAELSDAIWYTASEIFLTIGAITVLKYPFKYFNYFSDSLVFSHNFKIIWFQSFDYECTRWRLFQKRIVCTKLHIYVFITTSVDGILVPEWIVYMTGTTWSLHIYYYHTQQIALLFYQLERKTRTNIDKYCIFIFIKKSVWHI